MDDQTLRGGPDKQVPPKSGRDKRVLPKVKGARLLCPPEGRAWCVRRTSGEIIAMPATISPPSARFGRDSFTHRPRKIRCCPEEKLSVKVSVVVRLNDGGQESPSERRKKH